MPDQGHAASDQNAVWTHHQRRAAHTKEIPASPLPLAALTAIQLLILKRLKWI